MSEGKVSKSSSGKRRGVKIKNAIRALTKKIARWERNKNNVNKKAPGKTRDGWNTAGLTKQVELLQAQLKSK